MFSRTKHGADRITRDLERDGFDAAVIHGNKSQNARQKALNGFRDGTRAHSRGDRHRGARHRRARHQPRRELRPAGRGRRATSTASAAPAATALTASPITLCDPARTSKLRQVEKIIRMKLPISADHLGEADPVRTAADRQAARDDSA